LGCAVVVDDRPNLLSAAAQRAHPHARRVGGCCVVRLQPVAAKAAACWRAAWSARHRERSATLSTAMSSGAHGLAAVDSDSLKPTSRPGGWACGGAVRLAAVRVGEGSAQLGRAT